jgi:hypothetical protein
MDRTPTIAATWRLAETAAEVNAEAGWAGIADTGGDLLNRMVAATR